MNKIRLHGFLAESEVNGPGKRSVIWTQGCNRRCSGCWNKDSWDPFGGEEHDIDLLIARIPFDRIQGISFSGGEPFLQAISCALIAEDAKARGKDVLCYTGFTLEELRQLEDASAERFLKSIDILIDGAYIKGLPTRHPWCGSGNQRVLRMMGGTALGELLYSEDEVPMDREIRILGDGTIITTGF
ncbi:4Fe-4S single cluster domain-containing protein [Sediminispirochaeta bajacaliforniensis]|uniref:4Fe-4S single cluster domain-containing protein n=1 Tax=Sediminispirochaeta bajacaliforniensis TaxID=148 RepID=UPI000371708B|nr:4Fe-4S single cluster domain-containing protein [Sediminispirochaeta bajacaliforniensis]